MLFNTGENCVRVAALLITELWRCRQCKLQSKSNVINSWQNKRWLIFFPECPNGSNRLFKRLIHVTSKLLPPQVRNPFVPLSSFMFYTFSAAENPLCACIILYSFIITSRTGTHSMHAVQILCIIHVWWCYSSFSHRLCCNIGYSRKVWEQL